MSQGADRGKLVVGMIQALSQDAQRTVETLTAGEYAKNPNLMGVVRACAAGLAFHRLLADLVAKSPESDREMLRKKISEWAENTVAGHPTSLPGGLPN